MNAGISKRVVGLAVLVVAVLAVLLFLPRHETVPAPGALPVAAVPLGTHGPLDSPAPAQAASADSEPDDSVDPDVPDPGAAATAIVAAPPAPSTVWKQPAPTQAVPNEPTIKPAAQAKAAPKAPAIKPAAPPARIAPAKPAPAPKAVQHSAAQGHFYIQVASFGDAGNAKAVLKKLEAHGFHGTIGTARVKGKTWTRVQVGPYANRASAQAAQTRLKAQGYGGSHVFEKR